MSRYLVDNGCKWRASLKRLPPWRTVDRSLTRWAYASVPGLILTA